MSVITQLRPEPAGDVVKALRKIADQLEQGDFGEPISTALLILGHTGGAQPKPGGGYTRSLATRVYAMGTRTDPFTIRGLVEVAFSGAYDG